MFSSPPHLFDYVELVCAIQTLNGHPTMGSGFRPRQIFLLGASEFLVFFKWELEVQVTFYFIVVSVSPRTLPTAERKKTERKDGQEKRISSGRSLLR